METAARYAQPAQIHKAPKATVSRLFSSGAAPFSKVKAGQKMGKTRGSDGRWVWSTSTPHTLKNGMVMTKKNNKKMCEANHGQAVNECGSASRKSRCPRVAIGMMSDYQVIERLSEEFDPSSGYTRKASVR